MPDFITLTCPSCNGKLQITNDVDRFACSFCGNEHIVRRAGGIVSLAPVVAGIGRVEAGVNDAVSELRVARLRDEIREIQMQIGQTNASAGGTCFVSIVGGSAFLVVTLWTAIFGFTYFTTFFGFAGLVLLFVAYRRTQNVSAAISRLKTDIAERENQIKRLACSSDTRSSKRTQ